MRPTGIGLLAVSLLALGLASGALADHVFTSPKGNIVCVAYYRSASIVCTVLSLRTTHHRHHIWFVDRDQVRQYNQRLLPWNPRGSSHHRLPYGRRWAYQDGSATCLSRRNGMRCWNWHGHGFFLSRAYQRTF